MHLLSFQLRSRVTPKLFSAVSFPVYSKTRGKERVSKRRPAISKAATGREKAKLTWLKDERASYIDVPAVTSWFNALIRANERAYNEGSRLTDGVERTKLDTHGSQREMVVVERKDEEVRSVARGQMSPQEMKAGMALSTTAVVCMSSTNSPTIS